LWLEVIDNCIYNYNQITYLQFELWLCVVDAHKYFAHNQLGRINTEFELGTE